MTEPREALKYAVLRVVQVFFFLIAVIYLLVGYVIPFQYEPLRVDMCLKKAAAFFLGSIAASLIASAIRRSPHEDQ